MTAFDLDYLRQAQGRLLALAPDARPRWGRLDGARVIQHLHGALRYSLGELPAAAPQGSWLMEWVIGPLAIRGLAPVPRHTEFRRRDGSVIPIPMAPGSLADLVAAGEAFVARAQAPGFQPPPHPAFGKLGARGWSRLHYRHFEHHLRQFGL